MRDTPVYVFLVLALVAVASAVGVVAFKSPVRSALSLVLTFFTLALLYFNLGAQLLGISQIMVYAGAIMVLFLFVVMMLRLSGVDKVPEKTDKRLYVAVPLAIALTAVLLMKFVQPLFYMPVTKVGDDYGRPSEIGPALFTTYVWPFEIASVLLLIGVVGSIMLAKRKF
jgi:NADH-quinone oxidoreductase subunit J